MNKKDRRNTIFSLISTFLFLVVSTYCWYHYKTVQLDVVSLNRSFNQMYLSLEEVGDSVLMKEVYPESDEQGMKQNGYTFKIRNTKDMKVEYKLVFMTDDSNTLDNKYIRYTYNVNGGDYHIPRNLGEDRLVIIDSISSDSVKVYNLKFWIDFNAGNEIMNKSFSARIGVQSI